MANNLVIVESPTKAKTIKKMLGSNYKVVASVGHIRDLPKSKLGIDLDNDFEPQYINIRGKGPLIKELKNDAKKSKKIFLATDPDREGEAISWHLSHILGLDPSDNIRVTFNEITKDTVKAQIKNPRAIDMDLVDAQQARRSLDRLAGYKISPLLWKKVKNGLSAGRVQSVVLKIICDREQLIEDFISEEYWTIEADLKSKRKSLEAKYYGSTISGAVKKVELKEEKDADEVLSRVDNTSFIVEEIKEGSKKKNPSNAFTTSTLQQEASKKLNFSTKKTMMIAQSLYEGIEVPEEGSVGLITYMRTDSTRISKVAQDECLSFINKNYGKEYLCPRNKVKKNENIQDAHECIRPTNINRTPHSIKDSLSRDEFKLYSLIWKRFVASQMEAAIYNTLNLSIKSNTEIFKTSGSTINFEGFLKVYDYSIEKDNILPVMNVGDNLALNKIDKTQHFTQPPARYNEASLIKLLEEIGVGRPSTYAPTISTLLSRYYVVQEEKRIVPTELGLMVNEILCENFSDLVNEEFTAYMESELDKIADGELYWKELIRTFYAQLAKELEIAEKKIKKVEIRDEETDVICDKCGRNMVIKMGRFGKFLACPGFPDCRNAKPLIEKVGVSCPKCKGEIVVKRSKKGRKFFGCSNYPECDFVTWNEPINKKCPKCGEILTKTSTKKGTTIKCSDKNCDYRENQAD